MSSRIYYLNWGDQGSTIDTSAESGEYEKIEFADSILHYVSSQIAEKDTFSNNDVFLLLGSTKTYEMSILARSEQSSMIPKIHFLVAHLVSRNSRLRIYKWSRIYIRHKI